MAVLTKDEFFDKLCNLVGNDTSEESVKTVEDFTDTYNALEAASDGSETEKLRRELDETNAAWAKRYRDRFFSATAAPQASPQAAVEAQRERAESMSVEDLFAAQ